MTIGRPPIPTEERKPAWRLACLAYRAKRRQGASHLEAHEAAVAAVQSVTGKDCPRLRDCAGSVAGADNDVVKIRIKGHIVPGSAASTDVPVLSQVFAVFSIDSSSKGLLGSLGTMNQRHF
jgi:hypothetical protein